MGDGWILGLRRDPGKQQRDNLALKMIRQPDFDPIRFLDANNHAPIGSYFIEKVRAVVCFVFRLQDFTIDRSGVLRELHNNAAAIGGFRHLQSVDLILRNCALPASMNWIYILSTASQCAYKDKQDCADFSHFSYSLYIPGASTIFFREPGQPI